VTIQVALVVPEGEIWSGPAQMVIAKTLDGDIGVLAGHAPVIGILVEGSVVRIRPDRDTADSGGAGSGRAAPGSGAALGGSGEEIVAAVGGGFFSIANDRVSILARQARLGSDIDTAAVQAALDSALEAGSAAQGEEPADVRYYRAQLRAAGSGS
jgi:F-type H+-transporting ATPase subunit epsilon